MPNIGVNWMAILPQLILSGMACLILVVSAGRRGKAGNGTLWLAVLASAKENRPQPKGR